MTDIKFIKNQFEALLKLVYLGNWMVNADRTTDIIKEFEEVEKYLFSKTSLFGLEKYSYKEMPSYPSALFEEIEAREYIDTYNDQTFWELLAEELAKRQIRETYSEEDLIKMDRIERVGLLFDIEEKYQLEFEKNGIRNFTYNS